MISFLKNAFEKTIQVCAVLTVAVFTVIGGLTGSAIGRFSSNKILIIILGIICGLAAGCLISVLTYGFMATVLHISKRLDQIYAAESRIPAVPGISKTESTVTKENTLSSDAWICLKCGTKNSIDERKCKNCGQ